MSWKKDGVSESTIIIGPSKSFLVYALHSLEKRPRPCSISGVCAKIIIIFYYNYSNTLKISKKRFMFWHCSFSLVVWTARIFIILYMLEERIQQITPGIYWSSSLSNMRSSKNLVQNQKYLDQNGYPQT